MDAIGEWVFWYLLFKLQIYVHYACMCVCVCVPVSTQGAVRVHCAMSALHSMNIKFQNANKNINV